MVAADSICDGGGDSSFSRDMVKVLVSCGGNLKKKIIALPWKSNFRYNAMVTTHLHYPPNSTTAVTTNTFC